MHIGSPRSAAIIVIAILAFATTACGASLPRSVVKGSEVSVGWNGKLTSTNTASTAGATPSNLDIASLTRGRFGTLVEDTVEANPGFGTAKIVHEDPFTVRYDLAKPRWSDGTPVDTADLMLAWAAGSDYFRSQGAKKAGKPVAFGAVLSELRKSSAVPKVDQGSRSIDVRFSQPVEDWKTALDVAVPAHVVGERALGIKDPMEAKQAVEDAVVKSDGAALAKIAKVWKDGFGVAPTGRPKADALLSDGPYQVETVRSDSEGQHIRLTINRAYSGSAKPTYQHLDLTPYKPLFALDKIGKQLDVVQVDPTAQNWSEAEYLQRRDFGVTTSGDGTVWAIVLRAKGSFQSAKARTAFIKALPRGDLSMTGAGKWNQAYESTDSVLFPPGGKSYQIDEEDSGFTTKFKSSGGSDRGPTGSVCLAYDTSSAFASGVFDAVQQAAGEAGWSTKDCGAPGIAKAVDGDRWNAVLTRLPVPQPAASLAATWGTGGGANISGLSNPARDRLIKQLGRTANPYDARDIRVKIEKTLVQDSVVAPLAINPVVTVSAKGVDGVQPASGSVAPLLSTAVDWAPPKK